MPLPDLPAVVILFFVMACPPAAAAPELTSNTPLSTAGYFRLTWTQPNSQPGQKATEYELQRSVDDGFAAAKTVYRGPDNASVISGLPDRTYYYRVRFAGDADWSKPVEIEVKHHPLSRAFGFFALGAAMFAITVIVLIKGARGKY